MVYYPNSLTMAETFIVMAKRVFDDAIIHNALAMNELPPFTMTGLRAVQMQANKEFWRSKKKSQLRSIYNTLQNTNGIPSKEEVMQATRESPLEWDAVQTLTQYEHQSKASLSACNPWFTRIATMVGIE